jgi:hypothetical protein
MLSPAAGTTQGHAATARSAHSDHERQRALVLASLLARPGTPDSTHRRWAGDRTGGRR